MLNLLYRPTLTSIHDYWKNHSFDYMELFGKIISMRFNMLSRFVIAFLPRSKRLLISWPQSTSAVILEPSKIKSDTVCTVSPSISLQSCPTLCHPIDGSPPGSSVPGIL